VYAMFVRVIVLLRTCSYRMIASATGRKKLPSSPVLPRPHRTQNSGITQPPACAPACGSLKRASRSMTLKACVVHARSFGSVPLSSPPLPPPLPGRNPTMPAHLIRE